MSMGPKTRRIAALERDKAELTEQLDVANKALAAERLLRQNAEKSHRWAINDMTAAEAKVAELTEQLAMRETTLQARIADRDDALKKAVDRLVARNALIERLRERYWRADIACPACGRVVRGSVLEELGYCPRCLRADGQAKAPAADGQPRPDGGGGAAGC